MGRIVDGVHAMYRTPAVARILHTTPSCLEDALAGCHSVLDLGCGARSPVPAASRGRTIGVELFEPAVRSASHAGTHDAFVLADLTTVEFRARSTDAVVLVEVLEHLAKPDGLSLLDRAERWARRKVIVTTPNGFVPQAALEGNPYQEHLSGWSVAEMQARGYRARGLAGLKQLRKENDHDVVQGDHAAMLSSIRLRPRLLWLGVSAVSQLITYRVPRLSFGVLYVRDLE